MQNNVAGDDYLGAYVVYVVHTKKNSVSSLVTVYGCVYKIGNTNGERLVQKVKTNQNTN